MSDRRVEILTQTLAKLSNELIAAGNTEPQPWHSDNEKRTFVVMKRMGNDVTTKSNMVLTSNGEFIQAIRDHCLEFLANESLELVE